MKGFGVCMTARDFECILCQRHFTRVSGDMILTEDLICDDCLVELYQMEENELRRQVSKRLVANPSRTSQEFEKEVIRIIQQFGQHQRGNDAHDINLSK